MIKSNQDYPQIIINSIPAPELIYDKISVKDLEPYTKGLKELDEFGVDFIVMVCNTIHLYYDKLQKEIKTPIIDLKEELKKRLVAGNVKIVTVLGTPNTIKKGLYKFDSIKYINPAEKELNQLSNAIFNFNKGVEKGKQKEIVKKICKKYSQKADITILGCTEFAIMLKKEKNVINTIDVLVNATIDKIQKL